METQNCNFKKIFIQNITITMMKSEMCQKKEFRSLISFSTLFSCASSVHRASPNVPTSVI